MKTSIYNIIALMFLLPLCISCIVDDSDVNLVDSSDLTLYAKKKLVSTVALPVEALELAVELDEYIRLPEEEKAGNKKFHASCKEIGTGFYSLSFQSEKEFRYMDCYVETGNRSIWEQDAVWTFHNFSIWGNDFEYSNLDYSWELPGKTQLVMMSASDSTWAMTIDDIAAKMKMLPKHQDSLFVWSVTAQGMEETGIGVRSEFGTKSDLLVKEKLMESGERTNSYSGLFYVDIYKNGEPLDYCHASFDFNRDTQYNTSR